MSLFGTQTNNHGPFSVSPRVSPSDTPLALNPRWHSPRLRAGSPCIWLQAHTPGWHSAPAVCLLLYSLPHTLTSDTQETGCSRSSPNSLPEILVRQLNEALWSGRTSAYPSIPTAGVDRGSGHRHGCTLPRLETGRIPHTHA